MHNVSYLQRCPVCSRLLRIRVSLLGKQVFCQHCGGKFLATDPATRRHAAAATGCCHDGDGRSVDPLLERVESVLQRAGQAVACHGHDADLDAPLHS